VKYGVVLGTLGGAIALAMIGSDAAQASAISGIVQPIIDGFTLLLKLIGFAALGWAILWKGVRALFSHDLGTTVEAVVALAIGGVFILGGTALGNSMTGSAQGATALIRRVPLAPLDAVSDVLSVALGNGLPLILGFVWWRKRYGA